LTCPSAIGRIILLSLDPQINYSDFAVISVRTHEVFSEHRPKCIVYTLYVYIMSFQGRSKILSFRAEIKEYFLLIIFRCIHCLLFINLSLYYLSNSPYYHMKPLQHKNKFLHYIFFLAGKKLFTRSRDM